MFDIIYLTNYDDLFSKRMLYSVRIAAVSRLYTRQNDERRRLALCWHETALQQATDSVEFQQLAARWLRRLVLATLTRRAQHFHSRKNSPLNPLNASCSKVLLLEGFSTTLF